MCYRDDIGLLVWLKRFSSNIKSLSTSSYGGKKKSLNENDSEDIAVKSEEQSSVPSQQNTINDDAIKLALKIIKKYEGCRLNAYQCSAGVWTIGYGHTVGVTKGMKISQERAEEMINEDIMGYYNCVMSCVGKICNTNQIASLTSFAFNLGNSALQRSQLLKIIKKNPNNLPAIQAAFMQYTHSRVNGKMETTKGLVIRREAEYKIYSSK